LDHSLQQNGSPWLTHPFPEVCPEKKLLWRSNAHHALPGWGWCGGVVLKRKGKGKPLPFSVCQGIIVLGWKSTKTKKIKKNPNSAESGREVSRDLERTAEIWRSPNLLKILKDQFGIFPNIWINPKI